MIFRIGIPRPSFVDNFFEASQNVVVFSSAQSFWLYPKRLAMTGRKDARASEKPTERKSKTPLYQVKPLEAYSPSHGSWFVLEFGGACMLVQPNP
jgi:hypothetical protein